jgi:hypothetical protein
VAAKSGDLNGIEMYRQHTPGIAHGVLGIGAQIHEHLLEQVGSARTVPAVDSEGVDGNG